MRKCVPMAAALMMLCLVPRAEAWGFKEHMQLTRLAVGRLIDDPATPPDLRAWLKTLVPDPRTSDAERAWFLTAKVGEAPTGLSPFETFILMPDVRSKTDKKEKVPPVNVPERMYHFLDMELFLPAGASRKYNPDLSGKAAVKDIPHDPEDDRFIQAGTLPFGVERSYNELVKALRAGRTNVDPAKPDDDNNAVRWAGFLAHYIQDNCQPLHATEDYKSASYFVNKRLAPNVHSALEWQMNDDADHDYPALRAEFWDAFIKELATLADPVKTTDPWAATVEVSALSYDNLPLIGSAAVASPGDGPKAATATAKAKEATVDIEKFFHFEGDVRGEKTTVLRMKARQQAWAVLRTQRLIKQAWIEAHTPATAPAK